MIVISKEDILIELANASLVRLEIFDIYGEISFKSEFRNNGIKQIAYLVEHCDCDKIK